MASRKYPRRRGLLQPRQEVILNLTADGKFPNLLSFQSIEAITDWLELSKIEMEIKKNFGIRKQRLVYLYGVDQIGSPVDEDDEMGNYEVRQMVVSNLSFNVYRSFLLGTLTGYLAHSNLSSKFSCYILFYFLSIFELFYGFIFQIGYKYKSRKIGIER